MPVGDVVACFLPSQLLFECGNGLGSEAGPLNSVNTLWEGFEVFRLGAKTRWIHVTDCKWTRVCGFPQPTHN